MTRQEVIDSLQQTIKVKMDAYEASNTAYENSGGTFKKKSKALLIEKENAWKELEDAKADLDNFIQDNPEGEDTGGDDFEERETEDGEEEIIEPKKQDPPLILQNGVPIGNENQVRHQPPVFQHGKELPGIIKDVTVKPPPVIEQNGKRI